MRSPCATCAHGQESKNKPRCRDCARRIAYVDGLAPAPECRHDPAYQMSYSLPSMLLRQLGPTRSFSDMDMILTF